MTLLATLSSPTSGASWNRQPTSRRRYSALCRSGAAAMSRPSTTSRPLVGWSRAATRFSSVLLPLPDGPLTVTKDPAMRVADTSKTPAAGPAEAGYVRLTPSITTVLPSRGGARLGASEGGRSVRYAERATSRYHRQRRRHLSTAGLGCGAWRASRAEPAEPLPRTKLRASADRTHGATPSLVRSPGSPRSSLGRCPSCPLPPRTVH